MNGNCKLDLCLQTLEFLVRELKARVLGAFGVARTARRLIDGTGLAEWCCWCADDSDDHSDRP